MTHMIIGVDGISICMQGGTCLILGDDPGLMIEAARAARKALGCTIYRRSPSFR